MQNIDKWNEGLEVLSQVDISRIVGKLRELAIDCGATEKDIIVGGNWLAKQLREACGPEED